MFLYLCYHKTKPAVYLMTVQPNADEVNKELDRLTGGKASEFDFKRIYSIDNFWVNVLTYEEQIHLKQIMKPLNDRCPVCGEVVFKSNNFCPECGAQFHALF